MIIGLVLVGYVVMGLITVFLHVRFFNDGFDLQPLLFFFFWFIALPFLVVEGFITLDRFLVRKMKERKAARELLDSDYFRALKEIEEAMKK